MSDVARTLAGVLADRYRIERELGAGGMATVHLAEDLRHHRKVAIKVLEPELARSLGADRFLREIETTANLRHPHILPLYDSGSVDGALFYVMPLVEGESLRDRLTREKQLPIDDALQIAREVSDALSYAHSRGVVHRDIKPENILLESGHAVVADFGIARAVRAAGADTLTATGVTVGTPAYMSPEQAAGDHDLDGRSDLYALGCVLYEMLAGQPPFTGPTAESIIRQHMVGEPVPVTNLRPAVPPLVAAAVARALAKNPADRFNPVAQFGDALRASDVAAHGQPAAAASPARSRRRIALFAAVGVAVAVTAFALLQRSKAPRTTTDPASIAVLPFSDASPDRGGGYLGDGIAETLITALGRVPALQVAGKTSAFSLRDNGDVQTIGRQLGVATVLEGSVQRAGDRLRITAQLLRAADRRVLWSDIFDRTAADIFAVQDEVARAVIAALRVRVTAATAAAGQIGGTQTPAAYEAYMRGRFHWNKRTTEDMVRAADYFTQAIAADSSYALAWSGLADSYVLFVPNEYDVPGIDQDSILTLAEICARRALALAPTLGEAYSSLGEILEYRLKWTEATDAFERGVKLSPAYATGHQWYAYNLMAVNRWNDAIRESEEAYRLDPLSQVIIITLGFAYDGADRFDEAAPLYVKGVPTDSRTPYALGFAFTHEMGRGRVEPAAALYRRYLLATGKDSAFAERIERGLKDPATRVATGDEIARISKPEIAIATYRRLRGDDATIAFVESLVGTPRAKDVVPFAMNGVLGPTLRANPRVRAALAKLDYPPAMFETAAR